MQRYDWSIDDYLLRISEVEDEMENMESGSELDDLLIYLLELKDELAEKDM